MERFSADRIGLLSYALACVLLYLAGMSFGGPLEFLFYGAIVMFLLSSAVFVANFAFLRFSESFSTEHPVKGEKIDYLLTVANESPVPLPRLTLSFRSSTGGRTGFPDEHHYLARNGSIDELKTISCPFRGIYEVGLDSAYVTDILGFFRFSPSVFFRTFYVYPRLVDIGGLCFEDDACAVMQGARRGECDLREETDYADAYRPGDSVRDIWWKRFFVTGTPLVRRYEHSAKRMVELFIDLRPAGENNSSGEEDLSLEILLALQKYLISKDIPFRSCGGGRIFLESPSGDDAFRRFYESTIFIRFAETVPFADTVRSMTAETGRRGFRVVITHCADYATIELLEEGGVLLFNSSGKTSGELSLVKRFGDAARRKGILFREISSSDAIAEALR